MDNLFVKDIKLVLGVMAIVVVRYVSTLARLVKVIL
jgi:hypothetical protein